LKFSRHIHYTLKLLGGVRCACHPSHHFGNNYIREI